MAEFLPGNSMHEHWPDQVGSNSTVAKAFIVFTNQDTSDLSDVRQ
jgi:hypothetical protein